MSERGTRSYRCRCDGRYTGCEHGSACSRPGGGYRSPYFCDKCDPRRIEHISANLREIETTFDRRASER